MKNPESKNSVQSVLSVDNTLLCMFQQLCTFQHTVVLIFGVNVLSEHCSRQQISVKNEGVLIFGGYLFTGFYGIFVEGGQY